MIRPYFGPSYRRAFSELVKRGLSERHSGEPMVCCDFSNPAIDSVGGRYYFSLVRDLIDAGFFPVFTAQRATLSTFGTSRMKSLLLKERLGIIQSLVELKEPYFLITDRDEPFPKLAEKVIKVSYEHRLCQSDRDIAFPVFVHPQITSKVTLPYNYQIDMPRTARIFFGGNTEEGKYDKNVIREVYGMLTRREVLANAPGIAYKPKTAEAWFASNEYHPYVLCETQYCKIPQERWLNALAKADFFLACPGVGMPLCHNLIEALAAGAIPILQYADYLPQPLKNGVNCFAFHDANSLRDVIQKTLAMDQAQIQLMREKVRDYYTKFLTPGQFSKNLFEANFNQNLLLNAYRVPRK
jgi:glycosyltransferase involved in cell wall biosynthesis